MPINGTSPVATKALSVASKKLCLTPVAWPSIRANGSLAATSLLHNWSPYLHSTTWKSEAHDERPQCRASRQYSNLASLLDALPPSLSEPSSQLGISLAKDVDVNLAGTVAGCDHSVPANREEVLDDERSSVMRREQEHLMSQGECSSKITGIGCATGSPSDMQYLAHDASVQSTDEDAARITVSVPQTQVKEEVAEEERLGSLGSRSNLQASPHPSTMLSYTAMAGNPGIAMSLARHEYESYVHRLERRCFDLFTENQELKANAEKAKASHSRTQELNLRLGREVQQARRESVAATEHLRQYVEKVDKTTARSKRRRAIRDQSTQTASCGTMADFDSPDAMDWHRQPDSENFTATSSRSEANMDDSFVCFPPGLESNEMVSRGTSSQEDVVGDCRCDLSHSWGCFHHRSYGSTLLLAHRDLQLAISHGPPGLELPCDMPTNANLAHLGIRVAQVASPTKSRKHRRGEASI